LTYRFLPVDRNAAAAQRTGFDYAGTLLLALTLAAYALAVTLGRGSIGAFNSALFAAAALGFVLFVRVQRRAAAPLVQLALFANAQLGAGFAMSALVTTVVMATLVVGPFYLAGALALDAVQVGLVLSVGPLVAALWVCPRVAWWTALARGRMILLAGLLAMHVWLRRVGMPAGVGIAYIAP
jgi:hypothetical protein